MSEDPKYAELRAELQNDDSSSHKDWSSVKDAWHSKAGEDQNEAEDLLELLKDSSSSMPSIDARARVLLQGWMGRIVRGPDHEANVILNKTLDQLVQGPLRIFCSTYSVSASRREEY